MNKENYFVDDFKMEYQDDRTPFMYTHLTEGFIKILDSMLDGGSALLSNRIVMTDAKYLITKISRVNDVLTVILNKEVAMQIKNEGIQSVIEAYFNDIIGIIEKYGIPSIKKFTPLFTCGYAYIPDNAMTYMIDTGIDFDKYHNKYLVMLYKQPYDILVKPYKSYFKMIACKIMGAKKVAFYDDQCAISIMEPANGVYPSIDKAYAYTMVMLFGITGIDNMLWHKEQMQPQNHNEQYLSQQPQIPNIQQQQDDGMIHFDIKEADESEKSEGVLTNITLSDD